MGYSLALSIFVYAVLWFLSHCRLNWGIDFNQFKIEYGLCPLAMNWVRVLDESDCYSSFHKLGLVNIGNLNPLLNFTDLRQPGSTSWGIGLI